MNFKKAMKIVENHKTVEVTPTSEENPYLVKIGMFKGLDECLQCRSLTKDGTRLEPGLDWEPVCYLLCFDDYIDGEWEIVDEDDFTEEDEYDIEEVEE